MSSNLPDWIELLLEQAMLAERGSLENPVAFIKRMNTLLGKLTSH